MVNALRFNKDALFPGAEDEQWVNALLLRNVKL